MNLEDTQFDADGFIEEPVDWDRELALAIASREGITRLNDDHWQIIEELRRYYLETGGVPVMRQMCRDAGLQEHCISELLDNPLRAWRIAGLPNPGEEAKAYLESAELPE